MRPIAISPCSSLGSRLDQLLSSRFALQARQPRITSTSDLPVRLGRAMRRLVMQCEWRAFGVVESELFVIVARARRDGRPAAASGLEVYQLDAGASVYSAAVWEQDAQRGWWLDSVLDLSYDCDHGWWLADLIEPQDALLPAGTRQPNALLEHPPGALR